MTSSIPLYCCARPWVVVWAVTAFAPIIFGPEIRRRSAIGKDDEEQQFLKIFTHWAVAVLG